MLLARSRRVDGELTACAAPSRYRGIRSGIRICTLRSRRSNRFVKEEFGCATTLNQY
jgi:hypothetical protein